MPSLIYAAGTSSGFSFAFLTKEEHKFLLELTSAYPPLRHNRQGLRNAEA